MMSTGAKGGGTRDGETHQQSKNKGETEIVKKKVGGEGGVKGVACVTAISV